MRATSCSRSIAEAWSGWAKTVRTIAATVSWAPLGTVESRLRMKWTRHRCQVDSLSTFAIAWRNPSWASEITSLTPFSPRLTSERRNDTQNWWSSLGPVWAPKHRALAGRGHADRDDGRDRDHAAGLTDLVERRVEPDVWALRLDRALKERPDLGVEPLADPRHLRARDALDPERPHEVVHLLQGVSLRDVRAEA